MTIPIIQIAGVKNLNEALMIANAGATHLGFPFGLDINAEDTTLDEANHIIQKLPTGIKPVLITYINKANEVVALMDKLGCNCVQIHGNISIGELQKLREINPNIEIWKSLVIGKISLRSLLNLIQETEPFIDAFITDTYDPSTGASGATGKVHDWQISRQIIAKSKRSVILAGGLNPENVGKAIIETCPAGVDVHTGVENKNGLKTKVQVEAFVRNAKKAFEEIENHTL
jgi:phosphoribosylanthranilate isomerase